MGWTGYATDRLQTRRSALAAALVLGVIWAALHIVPDLQAGHTPRWIVWQRLYSVALRVLIIWLYNNTGSVFAANVFHATDNVSFALFPNHGSHYDPFFVCLLATAAAASVTLVWGPETLTHGRRVRRYGRGARR